MTTTKTTNNGSIAALVLAGGKNGPEMQAVAQGAVCRAMIPLNDRPMLDYVLDALRGGFTAAGVTGRIIVVGDDVPPIPGCAAMPGGASLVDSLLSGASALSPQETRMLIVTADIPFLTAGAVADFLRQAEAVQPAEFVYPIVEAARCEKAFPGMKRTTLRIAEGTFTGGNLVMLDPAFLRRQEATLREAYARRKSIVGLANLLGAPMLLRLLGSRLAPFLLRVPHLEAAVGRALGGARARAVLSPFPEIGTDADRAEDIEIARRMLEKKESPLTGASYPG